MATYQHGIVSTAGGSTYGVIQSFSITNDSDTAELQDADGDVVDHTIYNEKKTMSCEFGFDTDASKPVPGDTIAVTGKD